MNDFLDRELPPASHHRGVLTLQVKLLTPTAGTPTRGSDLAVGYDLRADLGHGGRFVVPVHQRRRISTGVAMAIPVGYYGQVLPRSGLALKHGIVVMGGVIDPDYRGEVFVMLLNTGNDPFYIEHGDRIAQVVLKAVITPEVVVVLGDLDETARGDAGFGSTGVA